MARTTFGKYTQRLIRFLLWAGLKGLRFVSRGIPWKFGLRLAGGLGSAAYFLLGNERRKALHHLEMALGRERSKEDRHRIALESFRNLGRTFFEVLNLDRLGRPDLDRLVQLEGEEALKAAAEGGRGVLFVTAHIGNWELMGLVVAMRYPLAVVAAPIYDPRMEKIMIDLRAGLGIETLVRESPGSLKRLIAKLRRGGVIGLLIDQDTKTNGVFVPFFHRDAYTPKGPASLAFRTGASVVVGFIIREGLERHRIVIQGPLEMTQTGDIERDVRDQTARFTKIIEAQIRKTPEQWIWMHRRWKTTPGGAAGSRPEAGSNELP